MDITPPKGNQAHKLREARFNLGVSSILSTTLIYLMLFGGNSFAMLGVKTKLLPANRLAMERMSQKIQHTDGLLTYATNSITIRQNGNVTLEYKYLPASKAIYEFENGNSYPLITECASIRIKVFKRNAIRNGFDQIPISGGLTETKLIKIEWQCS